MLRQSSNAETFPACDNRIGSFYGVEHCGRGLCWIRCYLCRDKRSAVHREIVAVKRKVSDAEQISLSYMYPGKMQKIKAEYTRLYPMGRVETWRVRLQVAMFVFLALAAVFLRNR